MRASFPSHYVRKDEAFFAHLWAHGHFVFDANMLLNFFRYSAETRADLYRLLTRASVSNRLWIPYHVALEYHRHIYAVRYEPIGACAELAEQLKKARNKLRADEHRARVDKLSTELAQLTDEAKSRYFSSDEDEWIHKIGELFDGKVGNSWDEKRLADIYKEGEERYKKKIPPGFADASSKSGNERYGDLIVWKQIVEFATSKPPGIIFVTDDAKDDWWLRMGGQTVGPHPLLLEEIEREAPGIPFHMYSGEVFLEQARKRLDAELASNSVKEVARISHEQSSSAREQDLKAGVLLLALGSRLAAQASDSEDDWRDHLVATRGRAGHSEIDTQRIWKDYLADIRGGRRSDIWEDYLGTARERLTASVFDDYLAAIRERLGQAQHQEHGDSADKDPDDKGGGSKK
jgi:PIN like domain